MSSSTRALTPTQKENVANWTDRIQACRSSGKTVRDWCQENGFSEGRYYYWLRKLQASALASKADETLSVELEETCSFVDIGPLLVDPKEAEDTACEILVGKAKILVKNSCSEAFLQKLLKELAAC